MVGSAQIPNGATCLGNTSFNKNEQKRELSTE
jgi:hypothetical protein